MLSYVPAVNMNATVMPKKTMKIACLAGAGEVERRLSMAGELGWMRARVLAGGMACCALGCVWGEGVVAGEG